jgi:hypothetical protein
VDIFLAIHRFNLIDHNRAYHLSGML